MRTLADVLAAANLTVNDLEAGLSEKEVKRLEFYFDQAIEDVEYTVYGESYDEGYEQGYADAEL